MARFMRLEVIQSILEAGILPLFYHGEMKTAAAVINGCVRGGAKAIEYTNRGEMAYPVFSELVRHFNKANPAVIMGVGSIQDAPTAALFIAAGANFIVGPSFNPEIARLCNRRKILYLPGCSTETEISTAEESGAEICKIFPGESAGGPAFIKAVMAPCPWHRLLPTGGVDATEGSIREWINGGAAALGLGSKLISAQILKEEKFDLLSEKTEQCIQWVQAARGVPVFLGMEHVGLYSSKGTPAEISAWYERVFGFTRKEGNSSFFVSGAGAGRIEFPKAGSGAAAHLAVRVSDFDAACAMLQAQGISLRDISVKPESKSAYLDICDPEGNLVHILWLPR